MENNMIYEENNKNIIDFNEEFKKENYAKGPKVPYSNKTNSWSTILIYLFFFLLGGGLLITMLFFKPKDPNFLLLERASLNDYIDVLHIIDKDDYNTYAPEFKISEKHIYILDKYVYITPNKNVNLDWFVENESSILDGTLKFWPLNEGETEESALYIEVASQSNVLAVLNATETRSDVYIVNKDISIADSGIQIFLIYFIMALPLLFLNFGRLKHDFIDFKNDQTKPMFGHIISSIATMLVVTMALGMVQMILALLFKTNTGSDNQASIDFMLASSSMIWVSLSVVIFGPLVEELVYRAAIFDLVKNKKYAILVSTLIFGGIHITSEFIGLLSNFTGIGLVHLIITGVPYFGMGFFLGFWYEKYERNIFLLYIMHLASNLISVLLSII